jgi:hypothetical protein
MSDDGNGLEQEYRVATDRDRTRRAIFFSMMFITMVVVVANHPQIQSKLHAKKTSAHKMHDDLAKLHTAATAKKSLKHIEQRNTDSNVVHSARHAGSLAGHSTPQKVKVRLYMESKCPACKKYTSNYVSKILEAEGVINYTRKYRLR